MGSRLKLCQTMVLWSLDTVASVRSKLYAHEVEDSWESQARSLAGMTEENCGCIRSLCVLV